MTKRAMMIGLDGADPLVIKRLIAMGRLPNFERVLKEGVAHESLSMLGAFPTVTPPNWASIATGCWPKTHGVTCFFNHTLGKSLGLAETNWDSGRVKAELIWETFARYGKRSIMLNYCEAWPPRLADDPHGVFIDGTGVVPFMRSQCDFQKLVTLEKGDFSIKLIPHRMDASTGDCVVSGEQYEQMVTESGKLQEESVSKGVDFTAIPSIDFPLPVENRQDALYVESKKEEAADTIISPIKEPQNWQWAIPAGAKEAMLILNNGTVRRYVLLWASDGSSYDTIGLYINKKDPQPLAVVGSGAWSEWVYDQYSKDDELVRVAYKLRVINITADGSKAMFFMSHTTNISDESYFYPHDLCEEFYQAVGPMVPMAKFRRYEPLGENNLLPPGQIAHETFEQLMDWHTKATHYLFEKYADWQLFYIHLHGIDLYGHWYINRAVENSSDDWAYYQEMIYKMYELNDRYIGEMLRYLDDSTSIIITSDHGIIPESVGDHNPNIGSLSGISTGVMEDLGFTKTYKEREDGPIMIDWSKTRAIFQRTSYVYINLKGRDPEGIVEPADYSRTVDEVTAALYNYRHPDTGKRVVSFCMNREEMEIVGMGGPHCGDILVQLMPTYCLEHANCPSTVGNEGYSLNNLCMMIGAGLKRGETIQRVIRVTDVVPTLCHLTDTPMPYNVEGGVIYQALRDFEERRYE